jgi:hypothetical protein
LRHEPSPPRLRAPWPRRSPEHRPLHFAKAKVLDRCSTVLRPNHRCHGAVCCALPDTLSTLSRAALPAFAGFLLLASVEGVAHERGGDGG